MNLTALKIEKTGVRLSLSQEVISTAITYHNKFKEYGPIKSFSELESVCACIFLASKVLDETRKIRDILNCWKQANGIPFDNELTKEYYKVKERIVECEQVILRTFVFDVEATHPYTYFLNCCKSLHLKTETVQCGWSILLDSYITGKRNTYSYEVLAVAAIYIAIQMISDSIPLTNKWWLYFSIEDKELISCCEDLLTMYNN